MLSTDKNPNAVLPRSHLDLTFYSDLRITPSILQGMSSHVIEDAACEAGPSQSRALSHAGAQSLPVNDLSGASNTNINDSTFYEVHGNMIVNNNATNNYTGRSGEFHSS